MGSAQRRFWRSVATAWIALALTAALSVGVVAWALAHLLSSSGT